MRLKFEITDDLIHKFNILMQSELGLPIRKVDINDIGSQYQFEFCDNRTGGRWHFELDKTPHDMAWYTLHCSTQQLHLPIHYIKDIKIFCQQVVRIKQMQSDFIDSKKK